MLWITILGGLLMMGQHDRSEALFYYFRLEDQVPETHLLRLIEKYISFAFVREKLKGSYSDTGRPSIDPQLLLRILLIGYLYGISSKASQTQNGETPLRVAGLVALYPPTRFTRLRFGQASPTLPLKAEEKPRGMTLPPLFHSSASSLFNSWTTS